MPSLRARAGGRCRRRRASVPVRVRERKAEGGGERQWEGEREGRVRGDSTSNEVTCIYVNDRYSQVRGPASIEERSPG